MNWLACSTLDISVINQLLPSETRVEPYVDANGLLFIGADLLTDCDIGCTYEKAGSIIRVLKAGTPVMRPLQELV